MKISINFFLDSVYFRFDCRQMYDRAARTFQQHVGSTPDHVGPGSYDHGRKKLSEVGYAPFLSLTSRSELFGNDENPGPGSYDLRSSRLSPIKGGCTLANRAHRFDEKTSDGTPGPGAYEVQRKPVMRSSSLDTIKQSRLSLFPTPRKLLPPSIPDPKTANGFEENDRGVLVPQAAMPHDPTLGPAFYQNLTSNENDPSKSYHGIHFSKYSSKRTDFAGRPGPGPGDYDPNDSFQIEVQHMNLRSLERRAELQVPRYPEVMLKAATKENIPGPGRYSIKRELDPDQSPSKVDLNGLDIARIPFGSQSKRFDGIASETPGPGAYHDKVLTAFNKLQSRTTSLRQNPFNQTSTRFSPDRRAGAVPGPTQYHLTGFADENLRRAVIEGGRRPPFNATAARRLTIVDPSEANKPGPSSYDVNTDLHQSKADLPTSAFLSHSSREFVLEDFPGPTAYDVSHAYEALTTQHRKPPRTKQANQRQSQFLAAAKRTYAGEVNSDTPGPGAYDGFVTSRPHGFAPIREVRFNPKKSTQPGPADYELSPLLEDTVLRGTFNSTLNNPIYAKMQERAEKEEEAAAATITEAKVQTLGVRQS